MSVYRRLRVSRIPVDLSGDKRWSNGGRTRAPRAYIRSRRPTRSRIRPCTNAPPFTANIKDISATTSTLAMFRNKFWLSLVLTVPMIIRGHMRTSVFGYEPPAFLGSQWIAPAFGTTVFLCDGWPFVQSAIRACDRSGAGRPSPNSPSCFPATLFALSAIPAAKMGWTMCRLPLSRMANS